MPEGDRIAKIITSSIEFTGHYVLAAIRQVAPAARVRTSVTSGVLSAQTTTREHSHG
jgi:hypothetical protein